MTNKKTFIFDFLITQNCNYRCHYCSQSKKFHKGIFEEASIETINSVLNFIDKNSDKFNFEITVSGGEPLVHPHFFEFLDELKKRNVIVSVVSNFSFDIEKYKKIKDILGENFKELLVSLHLSQVKNLDIFLKKAEIFNSYKGNTNFFVASVLTDENVYELKKVASFLKEKNIKFELQHLRIKNKFVEYNDVAKEFISNFPISNIKEKSGTYSKICLAGVNFMIIYQNGECYRCYSSRFNRVHSLGNIKSKNFKLYSKPMPCLNKNCSCPKPILYNMVDYSKNAPFRAFVLSLFNAFFIPFYVVKNFKSLKEKFIQGEKFKNK